MWQPVFTNRFEKDVKRMVKRGHNMANIKAVIRDLIDGKTLDQKYRDHVLTVVSTFLCKMFIGAFFEGRQIITHFSYRV